MAARRWSDDKERMTATFSSASSKDNNNHKVKENESGHEAVCNG